MLAYLKKRQGILQGVCITGGEPTLQRDLRKFLQKIKELEYPIKLDTNGYMPGVLWELLQEHLIDYVAMDIKASRDNYARAAGLPHMDISRIEESIGILKSSGIPYEFRTTVVKGIHTVGEFKEIGRWIEGCPAYYLQSYQENDKCHRQQKAMLISRAMRNCSVLSRGRNWNRWRNSSENMWGKLCCGAWNKIERWLWVV